jgi:hypothetical protein
MFMDIDIREFLKQSWNKKELQANAKNLLRFIYHFNKVRLATTRAEALTCVQMSLIVQTNILRVENQKDRTHQLAFWIEVAEVWFPPEETPSLTFSLSIFGRLVTTAA